MDDDRDDGQQAQASEAEVVETINRMLSAFVDGTIYDPRGDDADE